MHFDVAAAQVDCDVGQMQAVVDEPFLDLVALVAQTDDEFVDAMGRIALHDVPEDGHPAYFDHGLGLCSGFLG